MKKIFIEFEYRLSSGHMLKYITADGLDIEILFEETTPTHILFAGHEIDLESDYHKGLYVSTSKGLDPCIVPIQDIVTEASYQIDQILFEIEKYEKEQDDMIKELSSPRLTGRI